MINYFKKMKTNDLISSLIFVVIGLVLLIWPGTSTQVVCMVLGGVLLAYGVIQIVMYLFAKEKTLYHQGMLILGIILSVIGAWILLKPEMIIAAVPVIMGIIIVMHGVHNIVQGLQLKGMDYEKWWIAFALGIVTVALGSILIYNPFSVVNTVVRVIGAFLIYDGISRIWIVSRVSKSKKLKEKIVDAEAVIVDDVEE
ncbi:MAG: DUF308 domain-containing protein [Lachnospiraceae bacterium]|nr:DUF308 domain-containing protein [Lachnospiraceae bacterium]